MAASATEKERSRYSIQQSPLNYRYLKERAQSTAEIEGCWCEIMTAMSGFLSADELEGVCEGLSAVLLLGNLEFQSSVDMPFRTVAADTQVADSYFWVSRVSRASGIEIHSTFATCRSLFA